MFYIFKSFRAGWKIKVGRGYKPRYQIMGNNTQIRKSTSCVKMIEYTR